jgi:hypothetical protein
MFQFVAIFSVRVKTGEDRLKNVKKIDLHDERLTVGLAAKLFRNMLGEWGKA